MQCLNTYSSENRVDGKDFKALMSLRGRKIKLQTLQYISTMPMGSTFKYLNVIKNSYLLTIPAVFIGCN